MDILWNLTQIERELGKQRALVESMRTATYQAVREVKMRDQDEDVVVDDVVVDDDDAGGDIESLQQQYEEASSKVKTMLRECTHDDDAKQQVTSFEEEALQSHIEQLKKDKHERDELIRRLMVEGRLLLNNMCI